MVADFFNIEVSRSLCQEPMYSELKVTKGEEKSCTSCTSLLEGSLPVKKQDLFKEANL